MNKLIASFNRLVTTTFRSVPVLKPLDGRGKTIMIVIFKRIWRRNWYFRIVSTNNKVIAQSEGYINKDDCLATAELIATARYVDIGEGDA